MNRAAQQSESLPPLPLKEWEDTRATVHMWSQIVGKIRLAQTPLINHWWNVPLYISACGLTTSAMPYEDRFFEMEFDFLDHKLAITCSDGAETAIPLEQKSVATFYDETMAALRQLGIEIKIWRMPVEIPNPIPFVVFRKSLHAVSRSLHRQVQSSTFFLGQF
jgi:hypothetical protein